MMILMKLNMILIFINHIILMIMILMFLFDIVLILFNANIGIKTSIDIAINYAFFMWSTSEEYGNIYIYTHKFVYIYIPSRAKSRVSRFSEHHLFDLGDLLPEFFSYFIKKIINN